MAEDTRTTVGPASGKDVESASGSRQRIRASANDNVLEPDALRGSEFVTQDADLEDEDEARRDAYRTDDEKKARKDELNRQKESRDRRAKARAAN